MKRIISVVSLLLCLCMVFAGCGNKQDENAPDGYKLASSEEADYLFYVPSEWVVDTSTLYTSAYVSAGDSSSVSVTAYGLERESTTVADWWKGYTEQFNEAFKDMETVSEEKVTMGGIEGVKYTYTAKMADVQYNFVCAAVVRGNYVYYMLYTSIPQYYEEHIEEFNGIVSNFKFK